MRTCPTCEYTENPDVSLICIRCGSLLPDTREAQAVVFKGTALLPNDPGSFETHPRYEHLNKLRRSDVALYVGDSEEPIIAQVVSELFLGRMSADGQPQATLLDLNPHGGQEEGVSRRHAVLRRLGKDIVIIDHGSTNGTRLNGIKLNAHESVVLRSGDRIQLGKLTMQIYLPSR